MPPFMGWNREPIKPQPRFKTNNFLTHIERVLRGAAPDSVTPHSLVNWAYGLSELPTVEFADILNTRQERAERIQGNPNVTIYMTDDTNLTSDDAYTMLIKAVEQDGMNPEPKPE